MNDLKYLEHYGIKGMKWGKRKKKSSYLTKLSDIKRRMTDKEYSKALEKQTRLIGKSSKDYVQMFRNDRIVNEPFSSTGKAVEKDYIAAYRFGKKIYVDTGTERYPINDSRNLTGLENKLTIRKRNK